MIHEISTRWVDTDAYGHINNARYFDYMTEARAIVLRQHMQALASNLQFILVDTHCNYQKPLFYPMTVFLKQHVTRIGKSSFDLAYEFFSDKDTVTCHATGTAKMVCFNPNTQRTEKLPEPLQQFLTSMMI